MNDGWIKLWRSSQDSEMYFSEKFTKWQAWMDLLILANHKDSTIFIRGIEVQVKTGQVARAEGTLAKRWRWSRDKVRRFISILQTRQQIRQQKTPAINLIEIINYEEYQQQTIHQTIQQKNNKQDNKQDTYKKEKNVKNVKKETTKVVTEFENSEKAEYGKKDINKMLEAVKEKVGCTGFKEPVKWQRIYGNHLVNLMNKLSVKEFARRVDIILKDDFHRRNCGSLKYLYNQIKGFVEPKDSGNISYIS